MPLTMTSVQIGRIGLVVGLLAGLAGCGSTSSLFGDDGLTTSSTTAPPTAQLQGPRVRQVVLPPILGATDAAAKDLVRQLNAEALKQNIALMVDPNAQGEYTLRGYVVASKDKKGVAKVTYTWDLSDRTGQRVNRITGEETGTPVKGKNADVWTAVPPEAFARIAEKTIAQIAAGGATTPQVAAAPATAPTPAR